MIFWEIRDYNVTMIYAVLILMVCLIIYYSVAKHLNPVPYFPTNSKDLTKIIKAINLTNDQTVIDFGAGTGKIIFETAKIANEKGLNTQFVAIDINFILVLIMLLQRIFHRNKNNIKIVCSDIFKYKLQQIIRQKSMVTIYIYFAPWINKSVGSLIARLPRPIKVVSYYYPINNLPLKRKINGEHDIFVYDIK